MNENQTFVTKNIKYLVTDNYECFVFADSKKEAAKIAEEEVNDYQGVEFKIYEIKEVGNAYIPDPKPVIEWYE